MRASVEILVVDDSDDDAQLTLDALRRAAPNANVLRLTDGEQALHFICSTDGFAGRMPGLPKLVLLDLQMPGMDGIAVLQRLPTRWGLHKMPVVFWTSSRNPLFIERALQAGASAYQVKPRSFSEYRIEMNKIVARWLPDFANASSLPDAKLSA